MFSPAGRDSQQHNHPHNTNTISVFRCIYTSTSFHPTILKPRAWPEFTCTSAVRMDRQGGRQGGEPAWAAVPMASRWTSREVQGWSEPVSDGTQALVSSHSCARDTMHHHFKSKLKRDEAIPVWPMVHLRLTNMRNLRVIPHAATRGRARSSDWTQSCGDQLQLLHNVALCYRQVTTEHL